MQIARDLAGFTMAEADILRKAIGKKIRKLLEEQKEKFVSKMITNKIQKSIAEKLGDLLEPFSRYGFNRSHAASYAMLSFQTAYLKCHYTIEFMASLLNADKKDTERIAYLIKECKSSEIFVLPPTVNQSDKIFAIPENSKKEIRFGLSSIKNVGENIVEAIIEECRKNGPYKSLADFLERVQSKDLNKRSIESLAKAGALDEFGERNETLKNMDRILEYAHSSHHTKSQNQSSLFSMMADSSSVPTLRLDKVMPAALAEKLSWEKELMGLYVSGHPLEQFSAKGGQSKNATTIEQIKIKKLASSVTLPAIITQTKRIVTKTGESMMFIKLQDLTDEIEAVVFPRTLRDYGQFILEESLVS